ncbi:MAG: diguanylate cyclase, partial [Rhodoferax sp.]|nr:diguanylate cyclase [Rhodoferax sp.]
MPLNQRFAGLLARLNHHVPIWLMATLVFAALWLHTFRLINDDYAVAVTSAQSETTNLARVSQEHAERIFYSIDQTLHLVRSEYQEPAGHLDLGKMSVEQMFDARIIRQVSVFDASGALKDSSLPLSDRVNVFDRDYFKVQSEATSDALFIARPEFDLAYGNWSIRLSRRIVGNDGEFVGVVVAALDPDYFTRFYAELKLGQNGVAALYDLNGNLMVRKSASAETFVGNAAAEPVFARLAQGEKFGSNQYRSVTDGVERLYHFKKLSSYPLTVLIGLASADVFAAAKHTKTHRLWEAVALSMALLLVAGLFSWYVVVLGRQSQAKQQLLTQLKDLSDHVPGMVYQYLLRVDRSRCFPFVSAGSQDVYRLSPEEIGQDAERVFALIHPDDVERVVASIDQSAQMLLPWSQEYRILLADGSLHWLLGRAVPKRQVDGSVLWNGFVSDLTEQKLAEENLRIAAAFDLEEGMFITNAAGIILRVNRSFSQISGYTAQEAVGQTPQMFSSGHHDTAFYTVMHASLKKNGNWQGEMWNRRKNGEIFPEWLSIAAVHDHGGAVTHYVCTLSDISKRKEAEAEIQKLAFYDSLTGLPNRRLLVERLTQALTVRVRGHHQGNGALLFVDVDNFKNLNDIHGHEQGDLMLQQVATRLNDCVREGDTVARLAGDDFVVMLLDLSDNATEAAIQAEAAGLKMLDALRQPYQLGHFTHHGSVSVGVALFQASQDSVEELLKRADLALYQAKDAGRDTLSFFDPKMQAAMGVRAELETDLRDGLENHQFLLYYQPQVDQQGCLTGVEALLRWQHPRRGMVSPASFIPLAEETGLILPLGQWVLETACRQLAQWAMQPMYANATIAVNVSALQFHRDSFVAEVLVTLERAGAPPNRLKLELTESLLVKDIEGIIAKMMSLKCHGVSF